MTPLTLLRRGWILFLLLFIGGCAPKSDSTPETSPAADAAKFPADDLGRAISLTKPAERVVCVGPGATEIIFALGAGYKLVGRDQVSDYPEAALKVPVVGDFTGPFPEKVVALRPDLIIVQGETYDAARAQLWEEKIGAPVVVLVPKTVHQVGVGIEKIGAWLGVEQKAQQVALPLKKPEKIIQDASPLGSGFFEVSRSPLWVAGQSTLIHDVMRRALLGNAAHGIKGYKQYSLEVLATQNPDFYILAQAEPNLEEALKELRAHPVIGKLACVREGRVIVLEADLVLRPGPRLAQGIQQLQNQVAALQKQAESSGS